METQPRMIQNHVDKFEPAVSILKVWLIIGISNLLNHSIDSWSLGFSIMRDAMGLASLTVATVYTLWKFYLSVKRYNKNKDTGTSG